MRYLKYFLAIVFLYIVIFISLIIPSFNHIKGTLTEKHLKENNLIVDNFMIKIEPVLLDHDYKKIKEYIQKQLKEDQVSEQLTLDIQDPFMGSK